MQTLQHPRPRSLFTRLLIMFLIVATLFAFIGIASQWEAMLETLRNADWTRLAWAMAFSAAALFFASHGFVLVCRLFDVRVGWKHLVSVGFISAALNNFASSGGAAAHSLRLFAMRRWGYSDQTILAISALYTYLYSLSIVALFPLGLVLLLFNKSLSPDGRTAVWVGIGLSLLIFLLLSAVIFSHRLRQRYLFRLLNGVWRRITGNSVRKSLARFSLTLAEGTRKLRSHRGLALQIALFIVLDWAAGLMMVWFCFYALGTQISAGVLVSGFAIGIVAGLLSMIPGGLGVQDTSMAGVFNFLGVPLEQAILVTLLFRLIYHLIPFLISLIFYRRYLLRQGSQAEASAISQEAA